MQEPIRSTNGLFYHTYGDPTMPPVILLMGLGMPASAWPRAFIAKLVQSGLFVIAPDNRDSGQSPRYESSDVVHPLKEGIKFLFGRMVQAPYTLENMAEDVEQLMDELSIPRAHIAGVSMGGMIAQTLAIRAPHRVASLICLSTSSGNRFSCIGRLSALRTILTKNPGPDHAKDFSAYCRRLYRALSGSGPTEVVGDYQEFELFLSQQQTNEGGQQRQLLAIMKSASRQAALRQLLIPTLIIHGKSDKIIPVSAARELHRLIENSRLVEIENMGHAMANHHVERICHEIVSHCYQKFPR